MSSGFRYIPLTGNEDDSEGQITQHPSSQRERPGATTGWRLVVYASFLSIFLSAANLSFLSLRRSYDAYYSNIPTKIPSVYMGLERLQHNPGTCRSRMTFPKAFGIFNGDNLQSMTKVHAPGDKTVMSFGEQVSAYVDFYVPDYNLENCTLTFQSVLSVRVAVETPETFEMEVWLSRGSASLLEKIFFDRLRYSPGTESTTVPFYCPSRSHIFLQIKCPAERCKIDFPLEGVTSMTASADSLSKSGFRLTQYEDVDCI